MHFREAIFYSDEYLPLQACHLDKLTLEYVYRNKWHILISVNWALEITLLITTISKREYNILHN